MRTVLVTGASGALGRRTISLLRARGERVRGLVHRGAVDADETVHGDLADAASLQRAAAGVDAVVHLAGITHARRAAAYRVNAESARVLAAAAGSARLVLVSTRAVGAAGGAYSASKAEAEAHVRGSAAEWVIVRPAELYGGGGTEGIDRMIENARRGRPVLVVGRGEDVVCPVHVDDAAAAIVAALDAPAGRTYTVAGNCMTARRFGEEVVRALGTRSRVLGIPAPLVAVAASLSRVLPLPVYPDQLARLRLPKDRDSSAARTELGFAPRPLEEGLRT